MPHISPTAHVSVPVRFDKLSYQRAYWHNNYTTLYVSVPVRFDKLSYFVLLVFSWKLYKFQFL